MNKILLLVGVLLSPLGQADTSVSIDPGILPQVAYDELVSKGWQVKKWSFENRSFIVNKSGITITYLGRAIDVSTVSNPQYMMLFNTSAINSAKTQLNTILNLQYSSHLDTGEYFPL